MRIVSDAGWPKKLAGRKLMKRRLFSTALRISGFFRQGLVSPAGTA